MLLYLITWERVRRGKRDFACEKELNPMSVRPAYLSKS